MLSFIKTFTFLLLAPCLAFAGNGDKVSKNESAAAHTKAQDFIEPLKWFTATVHGQGTVHLQWSNDKTPSGAVYLVERSNDGISFTTLATLPSRGSRYFYMDERSDKNAAAYYRISAVVKNDIQTVSKTLKVGDESSNALRVTAEEILNGQLQLNVFTNAAASGALKIMDSKGALVRQEDFMLLDGYNRILVADYNTLQQGNYYLTFQTSDGLSALKLER